MESRPGQGLSDSDGPDLFVEAEIGEIDRARHILRIKWSLYGQEIDMPTALDVAARCVGTGFPVKMDGTGRRALPKSAPTKNRRRANGELVMGYATVQPARA